MYTIICAYTCVYIYIYISVCFDHMIGSIAYACHMHVPASAKRKHFSGEAETWEYNLCLTHIQQITNKQSDGYSTIGSAESWGLQHDEPSLSRRRLAH